MGTKVGQKNRSWVFTLNNWTEEDHFQLEDEINRYAKYAIIGQEVGEEGTPHLQGYVTWKSPRAFQVLQKLVNSKCHWEVAKGNARANREYCSKDGKFREWGDVPSAGKRNDLIVAREMVKEGKSVGEIAEQVGYQATRHAQLMYAHGHGRKRDPKNDIHVIWHCGPTGSGKTRSAVELYPNAWISGRNLRWWDGYCGGDEVIIDDFRGDFCTFHELLRILDRYPFRVEVKGGSIELLATKFYITAPSCPRCIWERRGTEDLGQIMRRVSEVRGNCVACEGIQIKDQNTGVGGNTSAPTLESLTTLDFLMAPPS